jgi:hypothetical protein
MWVMNHLVSTCYVHSYGKYNNCPTSVYIMLCHYTWRWLSASNSNVWTRRLSLHVTNNINYFGCDYWTCYFTCAKGFTILSVVVGGPRWSNMEGLCAQLCTMSSSQCGWPNGPILHCGSSWPTMYVVWASLKVATMLICVKCSWGWHMRFFMPPMEEMPIGKWFCLQCTQ